MTNPMLRRNPHIPRIPTQSNRKGVRGCQEDSSSPQLDCTENAGEPVYHRRSQRNALPTLRTTFRRVGGGFHYDAPRLLPLGKTGERARRQEVPDGHRRGRDGPQVALEAGVQVVAASPAPEGVLNVRSFSVL